MVFKSWRGALLAGILLSSSTIVAAQDAVDSEADDRAAVWSTVESVWAAAERGDANWIETMLTGDFMGWPNNSPAPRSRASIRMWSRFEREQAKGITHELYPLSIVVHGDMAVVHYLYANAVQVKGKSPEVSNGRYTDVLVRDDGDWKFISWHGGNDE